MGRPRGSLHALYAAAADQPAGAAYDILPIFQRLCPPATPLVDRLIFTIAIARHSSVDYAKALMRVLIINPPKIFLTKPCCDPDRLQDRFDDIDQEVPAPSRDTTPYLAWHPSWLRSCEVIGLPRKCEHGHRVRRWVLRYELPVLPGFPSHVSLSLNLVVNRFKNGPAIINHYYQAVLNLTRLLQFHPSRELLRAGLAFPRPLDETDRTTNVLFVTPGFAKSSVFLAHLEHLQALILSNVINGATEQYHCLLDQAAQRDLFLPFAEPVARLKVVEIYQDVRANSIPEAIEAQLSAAGHALASVFRYTDPGREGGYGPLRPGEWAKFYMKSSMTWRRELLIASKTLRSVLKAPLPGPATVGNVRAVLDTLLSRYILLAAEIDAGVGLCDYDPAHIDWTPLFKRARIPKGDYSVARQLIIDHHNTPVARATYDAGQKKVLTRLQAIGVYLFNCKGKNGMGRISPALAINALEKAGNRQGASRPSSVGPTWCRPRSRGCS